MSRIKKQETTRTGEDEETRHALLVGMQTGTATVEDRMEVPVKWGS